MDGRVRKGLAGVVLLLVVALCAGTTTASADVLVNGLKQTTLSCGPPVRVGIAYQGSTGGPRWARITIRSSSGQLVWRRLANAKPTWRYWYIYTLCDRHYVLSYTTAHGTVRYPFYVK